MSQEEKISIMAAIIYAGQTYRKTSAMADPPDNEAIAQAAYSLASAVQERLLRPLAFDQPKQNPPPTP